MGALTDISAADATLEVNMETAAAASAIFFTEFPHKRKSNYVSNYIKIPECRVSHLQQIAQK
jgi:hypothetical protein